MDAQPTTRPLVAVLAGINGAGKSSSADPILRVGMRMPVFVNADTIARGLNAFDVESEAIKAGRIMLEHLRELAAKRRSFAFETTLSGRTYADWLKELCAAGYAAHLFYFWLSSAELAINLSPGACDLAGTTFQTARFDADTRAACETSWNFTARW